MTREEDAGLRDIRRKRAWIWFWTLSFIPAVALEKYAIRSGLAEAIVILAWGVGFILSVARGLFCECPRCGKPFFSTHGSPTLWNLFAGKCMQCGLPLKPERVIYPSLE